MALVALDWQRSRSGYRIEVRSAEKPALPASQLISSEGRAGGLYLVARGGLKPMVLKGIADPVAFDLANCARTPEGAQAFANKWGLLRPGNEIDVDSVYRGSQAINGLFEAVEQRRWREIDARFAASSEADTTNRVGHMAMILRRFPGQDKPHVVIRPQHLMSFCWAQAMQLVSADHEFRRCPSCGQFFGARDGGRSSRRFCGDRCRQSSHRSNKKAKKARAR